MFFTLLFGSLVAHSYEKKCNNSSLDPDYICCNDISCKEQDSTRIIYQICNNEHSFLAFITAFCIPTILFWILSCITKTNVPKCTWITNITINVVFSAVITSIYCSINFPDSLIPLAILKSGGITALIYIYISSRISPCAIKVSYYDLIKEQQMINHTLQAKKCCSCCVTAPHDPFKPRTKLCGIDEDSAENTCDCTRFIKESESIRVTKEELKAIMTENANIPPTPQAKGISFYLHKGAHVLHSAMEPIQYATW
ncbi:hypothetical protein TVAG_226220 [Trichomonas vaginalis G3]|uniref:Uncharacterized protein n=1 Tax=Trichomonas vaginalis (strain ATCC PRA-98 / G3) TaxID=412133 RepID=A2G5C9_TRIV3|nr:hypothetical protein TVAGG3_0233330 [Trichomonas vaginalis G3]EAX87640.1 hypothetical protein TVAG_226220 [Trichomonas vaginalis G3]KAI5552805.1 hypothetical protein TVAGG3_0233330 [Trichomonas vaginalis G3]|eukprot:XP_001300570.1 hypothetical protein [Trichomonas vaginalis G3]